eukprot:scaffold2625_cov277-Chaetoceros_neogracile.AAC.3
MIHVFVPLSPLLNVFSTRELCSHFGRPKGEIIETGKNGRLNSVVPRLKALLVNDVTEVDDCMGPRVEDAASKLTRGQVLLLENTRFYAGETKNDEVLAAGLGKLADYFVMDAFGTACRAHSSTEGVAKHMKMAAAGYLLDKELKFLNISSQSLCFFFASTTIIFATLSSSFLVKSFSF